MLDPNPAAHANSQDAEAALLASWVDDHAEAMFRFALMRVRDRHAVEDLLQETFLAAIKSSPSFRRESSPRTWLVAILRLKIIDHFRNKGRKKFVEEASAITHDMVFARVDKLRAWDTSPSSTLENREFWEAFQNCVSKLPDTLARAFSLREIDGCTSAQICELLGISNDNLDVRIFRARSALRDCLDKHWFAKD